jgi:2'-5' RNA ligase
MESPQLTRKQLTLFLNEPESLEIEKIRKTFNPEQYQLIKSHITLCREDEIEAIEKVRKNLGQLNFYRFSIDFGKVVRFSDEKGVLIPANGPCEAFHQLRKMILAGIIEKPRMHEPHITLMHPRNSTCTEEIFKEIAAFNLPDSIQFNKISLIEQTAGEPWQVLAEWPLKVSLRYSVGFNTPE